jgi:hypothetical protein
MQGLFLVHAAALLLNIAVLLKEKHILFMADCQHLLRWFSRFFPRRAASMRASLQRS